MWEVMLICDIDNKRIINYVYKMMKNYLQDKSCVLTTHDEKNKSYIVFACASGKRDYYKEMIKLCIIDYIINVYKYEYLIKNIKNFLHDEVTFKSFIKLLSLYDKQIDELALKQCLNLNKCFYIDSFINFRMQPLIKHWEELCGLAKENFDFFVSSESFLEIMRFLVATMEENCEKIKILTNNGKYSIYNTNQTEDGAEKIDECTTTFSLISAVLKICPKTIDVYTTNINDDAIKFLQNVYSDRVQVIEEKF